MDLFPPLLLIPPRSSLQKGHISITFNPKKKKKIPSSLSPSFPFPRSRIFSLSLYLSPLLFSVRFVCLCNCVAFCAVFCACHPRTQAGRSPPSPQRQRAAQPYEYKYYNKYVHTHAHTYTHINTHCDSTERRVSNVDELTR